jgi:PAS domain S-box-containing protein
MPFGDREKKEEEMDTKELKVMENQGDSELRQQAEEKLKEAPGHRKNPFGVSSERMAHLIHELQVHQIELEMQNDELRRIQGELERTRDKYSHLYDFAPVGYFTLSEKEIIEEVNLTGASMTGIERSALIGKPFSRFVLREDKDIFYKYRQRLLETETSRSCELRLVKNDGHEFYARMECMVIKNRGDDLKQIRAAVSDVSDIKQAEDVLRESDALKNTIIESSPDCIKLLDLEGNLKYMSKGGQEKLEIKDIKVYLNKSWIDFWQNEDNINARMAVDTAVKGAMGKFRGYSPTETGIPRWWDVIIAPLWGSNGEVEQLLAVSRDITEQKQMEEELLTARKLESVGMLAGGIAHDFNNILTAIIGNVSMARMQSRPGDEMFDLLSGAETASIRAQTLTRQLLTFAKGGAPVKETASIKDVIRESSLLVLRGSKTRCDFSLAEDLWPAEVDFAQMSLGINNIVINADRAMPEGGIIRVAAENLIIDDGQSLPLKPGRYIRVSISDQGAGIAEKHLANIFDPYFTTKEKGRGLELATTYSIIKRHDGHITVESQLGEGTTFHIYLPASDKAVPEKEEVKLIKGHGRILVMDDEELIREMVGRMLEKLGYESEFAEDGAVAIEMYKEAQESEKPYDAVILDLTIPGGMGGKEAIEKLLDIDSEVKAIVSSGYSDDPVMSNFQEYGFMGMIPKPFEFQSLSKVLHEAIKGKR